ncbi:MAG: hypothetical protein IPM53_14465 [Anaerolineaceae bacterium]|nr:hypothetical protein [Anaerolineaceae bacterium]
MTKINLVRTEKAWGDTAVDGLLAGLMGGVLMTLFLALVGWAGGAPPQATVALFDPAQTGNWLSGLLAHLAVSAIYGLVLALLLRGVGRIRPSLAKATWLWGAGYALLLWGLATAVASPLEQIPTWEFGLAHLLYGLAAGYRLHTNA